MGHDDILQLLTANKEELARRGVRTLALFGSAARGEARPSSDVDLLVEFEDPTTFDRYLDLEGFLEELLGRPVDLVTQRSLRLPLRDLIEKDARYVPGLSPVSG